MTSHGHRPLGLIPPKVSPLEDSRLLKLDLRHVRADELHPVPAAKDWWEETGAWKADPYGNDVYGNCAPVSLANAIDSACILNGFPSPITTEGVLDFYWSITGGRDVGTYYSEVFERARTVGLCGVKIEAAVAFDWRDQRMCDVANGLFGGALYGASLCAADQTAEIWDAVPGEDATPWGAHGISVQSMSPGMDAAKTWGERKNLTPRWRDARVFEAHVVLIAGLPAPSGLNLAQLRADLEALR